MKFNVNDAPDEGKPDFPKFELQRDEVARVNLLSTNGWEVAVRHWVKGMGYVLCQAMEKAENTLDLLKIQEEGGRPDDCVMCAMAGEGNDSVSLPKRQFAARMLRYITDLKGRHDSGGLQYRMEIWLFDNRKYRNIREILNEWGVDGNLRDNDLAITCTDEKWQNMTLMALKNALWSVNEESEKAVATYFKEQIPKYDLVDCLAQKIEPDALERRFAHIQRRNRTDEPVNLGVETLPLAQAEPLGRAKADSPGEDPFALSSSDGELPKVELTKTTEPVVEGGGDFLDELLGKK